MRLSSSLLKAHYKLVVAGNGAAGSAVAEYFSRQLAVKYVAVVDPNEDHYYQPGFTLVAGGLMKPEDVVRSRLETIPTAVKWFRSGVKTFSPRENNLLLDNGEEISYEYLVIATGLQLRFDKIDGLPEALNTHGVCSIYDYDLAVKTRNELQKFKGGKAIFTFPNTPIKCAGAPQKICYLAEEIFRKNGVRKETEIIYASSLGKIFGVDKYAEALTKIVEKKHITLMLRHNLIKVDSEMRTALFQILDSDGKPTNETKEIGYDFLHVAPPCSPIQPLRDLAENGDPLTDSSGWVKVSPKTLQADAYPNVFALGDSTNVPNGKTAAAVSSQFNVVKKNLSAVMDGKECTEEYDGYASCPLITDSKHVIMAEFNFEGPLETMPLDQSKPRYSSYLMKRYLMPLLYWKLLVKGLWNGPATVRKVLHLGMGK